MKVYVIRRDEAFELKGYPAIAEIWGDADQAEERAQFLQERENRDRSNGLRDLFFVEPYTVR